MKERRIVVSPVLPAGEGRLYDCLPDVLFVGTALAREPEIATRLIRQDRERLIQEQE